MPNLLSVVVVTFNSQQVVSDCLDSILALSLPEPPEVLVVDNRSEDQTRKIVMNYPQVRLLAQPMNLGFAEANNIGIAASGGRYVMLVNDDALVLPDCAKRLIRALESDPAVGSASPRIYKDEAKTILDSTGIVLNKIRLRPYDRGEGKSAAGRYTKAEMIFGATGACCIFRREMIDAVSYRNEFFDTDFFAYYEDVDLAWRGQVMGWRCLYVPDAEAVHLRRGPEGKPPEVKKHFLVNRYFCYVKNEVGALAWRYLPLMLFIETLRFTRRLVSEPYLVGAIPLFFRLLPRMREKRKWIQSKKTATIKYLSRLP